MKRSMKIYSISWLLIVLLFQMLCFLTPNEYAGFDKFSGAFWAGYGFIMGALVLHYIFIFVVQRTKDQDKQYVNRPLVYISVISLILMVLAGAACMIIPNLPNWLGILICYSILAVSVIYLLAAKVAGKNAYYANKALNERVFFFRDLASEAETLVTAAQTKEAKAVAQNVYEAIRYSDPSSDPALAEEEKQIKEMLEKLSRCILKKADVTVLKPMEQEILRLIQNRNNKCKNLKRK